MEMSFPIVFEVTKLLYASIGECCNYHIGADEYRRELRSTWQELQRQQSDTVTKMGHELLPGKTPKKEVEGWIQDVEKMSEQIDAFESETEEGKCCSRVRRGLHAFKMIRQVNKLYQRGLFLDSLVLDSLPSNGIMQPAPILIGESTERVKKDIWAWVLGDDAVRKIGVYGMGGIGKSTVMKHINNSLLKEIDKFDNIIWVPVSKEFTVNQLQYDIACKLDNLDLPEFNNEMRKAKLKQALEHKKKYVLILDDLWEPFSLEEVGIPKPSSENGCKLVLTTRKLDVCREMHCHKEIKMELLLEQEARNLFLETLGHNVFDKEHLEKIAEDVLDRCAQLPLAIVTIAAIFKCLDDDESEWRLAWEDLSTSIEGSNNEEEQGIIGKLRFSYDRLEDPSLKRCLLHCALHPEGFEIDKQELIEHFIDEEITERRKTRLSNCDKGHSMLKKLIKASLFDGVIQNNSTKKKFVKMHGLVREMVLQVACPQFKVGHLGLEDFSDEVKWKEDLVKASLMYKNISRISPNASPRCPKLSTLLLQGNRSLKNVPDSLFKHLPELKVLDISYTDIEFLPNSFSNLVNLTTLRLRMCENLKKVPSLAKLRKLEKLDLWETGITEVPDGLEMLVYLRYLDLNARGLKIMQPGILPKLSYLQYLSVFLLSKSVIVKGEEIASLEKLENFRAQFCNIYEFNTYIRSLEEKKLEDYQIHVGISEMALELTLEIPRKKVVLVGCEENSFLLPKDVNVLWIEKCNHLRSLCDVPSLNDTRDLKHIFILDCEGIKDILCCSSSSSSSCSLPLQTVEFLQIMHLDNLCVLFRKEKVASTQIQPDTFFNLKIISISECSKLKKLLSAGLLLHLHKLEEIEVSFCNQVEEIEEEEEKVEEGMYPTKITLPKLRRLSLKFLPKLKSICSSNKVIVCDSLEKISIWGCRRLKRLPLFLSHLEGKLSPPPSLKEIEANERWWDSLKWDFQDSKNVLQRYFHALE